MLPAHDLKSGKSYTHEEYDEILEALCLRLLSNSTLQVIVMHRGSDGKRRFGPYRLVNIGLDDKTFTVRDANESVLINYDSLLHVDWAHSSNSGRSTSDDVARMSLELTARLSDTHAAQKAATEAQTELLKQQIEKRAREAALRAPVNTHKKMAEQFVDNWPCDHDDMRKFPRILLPPRMFGDSIGKASAGFDTNDTLQLLAQISHDALMIMKWNGPEHAEKRKALSSRLAGNTYVSWIILFWMGSDIEISHRDAWVLAVEDFLAKYPDKYKLRFKLMQAHVVGPHAGLMTDEEALKNGIKADIRGRIPELPEDTASKRSGLLLKLTKDTKDGKVSIISPSYSESVTATPPILSQTLSRRKSQKGGAPASPTNNAIPMPSSRSGDGPVASSTYYHRRIRAIRSYVKRGTGYVKVARRGGGNAEECSTIVEDNNVKTRHKDMRPGARVRDIVLDLVIRGIVAAFQFDAEVLFPDRVRTILDKGTAPERSALDSALGKKPCFAPVLVQGNHWVLLSMSPKEISITDSARTHTKDEAAQLAYKLKQKVPGLRGALVVTDRQWPQQDFGSADCAFFVARAVLRQISGMNINDAMVLLTRKDIDSMLPPTSKDLRKSLSSDVIHQFQVRMADYLKRPHPPLSAQHTQLVETSAVQRIIPTSHGPAAPISDSSSKAHTCSFGAHMGPDALCGASLNTRTTIQCCTCKVKFCAKHAATWNDKPTWKCQQCRPPSNTKGMQHDPTDHTMPPPSEETIAKAEADFLSGQESPLLAHQAGNLLDALQSLKEINLHPLARKGVSKDTRSDHQRMLGLLAEAPVYQRTWPIARVALDALERGRLKYRWSWPTMGTKMGRMEGALTRLPLYTQEKIQPVLLRFMQEWKDAVSHNARLTAQFRATGLPAASLEDIEKAILSAPTESIKALIILSWVFVARVGDMSQVKTDCLYLGTPKVDGSMEVQCHFERGKVIGKIDPYTLTTTVPAQWVSFLQTWHSKIKTPFLFHMDSLKKRQQLLASTRKHLRTIRDDLDLKSVRRGAAQKMADAKIDLEQIRYFTRHKDVSMLRRYLRFGRAESVETRKGAAAGLALSSKSS